MLRRAARHEKTSLAGAPRVWEDRRRRLALLIGFLFGYVGSIPVAGPISLIVFAYGVTGRARLAIWVAAGGAIAEAVYAYLAFWGMAQLVKRHPSLVADTRGVGALVLAALGAYFLFRRGRASEPGSAEAPGRGSKRSFVLGFFVTALNPTLIVTWTAAATTLFSTGVLVDTGASAALPFAGGACVGIIAWFATLLALLSHYRSRFSAGTLDRVVRFVGVAFLALAAWFGWSALRFYAAG